MTDQTSTWTVLDQAHGALRDVVAAVPSDAWQLSTPCEQWTVAQVLQHAVGDQQGYAATITGEGWPTENPFEPSGHLTGEPVPSSSPPPAPPPSPGRRSPRSAQT